MKNRERERARYMAHPETGKTRITVEESHHWFQGDTSLTARHKHAETATNFARFDKPPRRKTEPDKIFALYPGFFRGSSREGNTAKLARVAGWPSRLKPLLREFCGAREVLHPLHAQAFKRVIQATFDGLLGFLRHAMAEARAAPAVAHPTIPTLPGTVDCCARYPPC